MQAQTAGLSRTPERGYAGGGLRDQRVALFAYDVVGKLGKSELDDYAIVVNDFGSNVLRSGLCAALAALERDKAGRGGILLEHLAQAEIAGLEGKKEVASAVRELDVTRYMLVTREVLRIATWLKKALQAAMAERG
ncbi:MAG: type III-B CRISPR module-associated protein Cmr5 [Planctomycetota bacterium]